MKPNKHEFELIINDILNLNEFKELDSEIHHGISRYGHSLRVAKTCYKISKCLHLDYPNITRAALLHDFYSNEQMKQYNKYQTFVYHQEQALKNATEHFELNEIQKNMIVSHMFPFCKTLPKYKESFLLGCVDKGVSAYEMYRYKLSLILGIYMIFFFNMITLQK